MLMFTFKGQPATVNQSATSTADDVHELAEAIVRQLRLLRRVYASLHESTEQPDDNDTAAVLHAADELLTAAIEAGAVAQDILSVPPKDQTRYTLPVTTKT
jgi:hypothetical protein